jgi:uncharacterized protein DUF4156
MRRVAVLIAVLVLAACAQAPIQLDPGAQAVKVGKSDPMDNFEEVGPVSGFSGNGCGGFGHLGIYETAVTDLKNKANAIGGTYVQIFTITEPHFRPGCFDNIYKISGTAYRQVREAPSPLPIVDRQKSQTTAERLMELNDLRTKGLISDAEYTKLRQQALEHKN